VGGAISRLVMLEGANPVAMAACRKPRERTGGNAIGDVGTISAAASHLGEKPANSA